MINRLRLVQPPTCVVNTRLILVEVLDACLDKHSNNLHKVKHENKEFKLISRMRQVTLEVLEEINSIDIETTNALASNPAQFRVTATGIAQTF